VRAGGRAAGSQAAQQAQRPLCASIGRCPHLIHEEELRGAGVNGAVDVDVAGSYKLLHLEQHARRVEVVAQRCRHVSLEW
jgi:hypothetical protein